MQLIRGRITLNLLVARVFLSLSSLDFPSHPIDALMIQIKCGNAAANKWRAAGCRGSSVLSDCCRPQLFFPTAPLPSRGTARLPLLPRRPSATTPCVRSCCPAILTPPYRTPSTLLSHMRKTSAVPYGQSNVGTERGPAGTGNGLPFFFVSPAIITAGSTVLVDYIVLLVANI